MKAEMLIGQSDVTSVPKEEKIPSSDVRRVYLNLLLVFFILVILDGRTVRTRGRWGERRQQTSGFPSATSLAAG
jgi:hypothetical protein